MSKSKEIEGVWGIFHVEKFNGELRDIRINSVYKDSLEAEHALKMLVEYNLPSYINPKNIHWRDSRNVHITSEEFWHDRYYVDFIPMNIKYEK